MTPDLECSVRPLDREVSIVGRTPAGRAWLAEKCVRDTMPPDHATLVQMAAVAAGLTVELNIPKGVIPVRDLADLVTSRKMMHAALGG